jgi:phosphatidylglycerophosphate synthase
MLGFYIGVIFFPPCENTFDFESLACGLSPCYEEIFFLNTWDYLGNGIVCTFIETISSIALIIRVLWQKRRARQPVSWRKHRKMAFQLLSISCLTLTIVFPQSLITVIQQVGGPEMSEFGAGLDPYLFYLYTFVVFLLPFICLGSLPELWKKLWIFGRTRRGMVGPMTLMVENGQTIAVRPRPN